eukprot:GHRR01036521.1.p1 GENE.GHRR01036521.1~~GHRR01036521.1.p1  ORF type:complete len:136 (-),score=6.37 GHRR01036521.1:268-675(-)
MLLIILLTVILMVVYNRCQLPATCSRCCVGFCRGFTASNASTTAATSCRLEACGTETCVCVKGPFHTCAAKQPNVVFSSATQKFCSTAFACIGVRHSTMAKATSGNWGRTAAPYRHPKYASVYALHHLVQLLLEF